MPRHRVLVSLLLAAALARYMAVACFVHPFADDLSYASIGMRTELLPRLHDEYLNWNGRWFSNALVLRGPLVLGLERGLWLYRAAPLVLMALTWLCARRLIRAVSPGLGRGDASLGAAWLLLLFLQLMPDLSEGVYWYTGAVSYLLPGALLLWLLALHAEAWAEGWRFGWPRAVGMGVLAAVIAGCNELHMVLMVGGHALLVLHGHAHRRLPPQLLCVALLTLASGLVMWLAPGNEARAAHFPLKHDALRTLAGGGLQTARFALTWILSPALLIASVLFLANAGAWLRTAPWLSERLPRAWPLATGLAAMLFVLMALPYWATGLLGQHRTANAALLALLPGWFLLLASIRAEVLRRSRRGWSDMGAGLQRTSLFLLFAALLATGSGGRVSGDLLSGRLARFDAQLQDRYATIRKAAMAGSATVVLPPLADAPHALRFLDATDDPEHWINRSVVNWLGADSLRISVR